MASFDRASSSLPEAYAQPGLEVVPEGHYHEYYSPEKFAPAPLAYTQDAGKEALPVNATQGEAAQGRPRRWWIWCIGALVLLVVILAAVLGGVLGSRAAKQSSQEEAPVPKEETTQSSSSGHPITSVTSAGFPTSPTTSSSSPVSTETSTNAKSIRQGSPLSVTGWRKSGAADIWLLYLDHDNQIRRSQYSGSSWGKPDKFTASTDATSRLGGTMVLWENTMMPQTELFYTGDGLHGVNFNDLYDPSYQADSIDEKSVEVGVNSSIVAYWPWFITQASNGSLIQVRNLLTGDWGPQAAWDVDAMSVKGLAGTKLALAPLSTDFTRMAIQGGYGIFYQDASGQLSTFIPALDSENLPGDYAPSWPADFPSITFPKGNPIAAFSTARPSDSKKRVNTYVLYLDSSSNINVVYSTDSSTWHKSQPSVFKNVDSDTDITCLTMATSARNDEGKAVALEGASSESRCYFQKKGLVREVVLDGTDWVDKGSIPIP